jgi:predicted nucleic acid-binding protein
LTLRPEDVPPGPLAVDTDVFSFIHLKKGRHAEFARLLHGHPLALPFPVVGELKMPAFKSGSQWGSDRLAKLEEVIRLCVVIPSDARVADLWAEICAKLRDQLQGGGVNDMWIAACCLAHGLPLATNNLGDFQRIADEFPALRLVHPDL